MLRRLQIRKLAIIDALELEFESGFGVLTGETGAGKSILIDALGLALGGRAETGLIRAGAERAEISAEFEIDGAPGAHAWLVARELADADACLIRRTVAADGRSRAFVNGSPVNAGELRELGECLVEIFGQGESQQLLRADAQRTALDDFGGHLAELAAVAAAAAEYGAIETRIEGLRAAQNRDPAQLAQQVDYLRFQLQELEALGLCEGDLEALDAEHKRLANAERLIEEGGAAQEALYGGETSAYGQLAAVLGLLRGLLPLHAGFTDAENFAANAQAQAQEAADSVRRELERLELDPQRLAEVERRLGGIHDLARKHRVRAADLLARHSELRSELETLEHASEQLAALMQAREQALAHYRRVAVQLNVARRAAAKSFAPAVTAHARELGMPAAEFQVAVESLDKPRPGANGDDLVRFDFSANPGQPPRPLAKVASGGELSRLSLAIQVSLHEAQARGGQSPPTMIFDEVDAGIGGATAEIVGRRLRALGANRQVLCVTHLAQIAAQGEHHLGIRKEVAGAATFTRVETLDAKARVAELSRMLGGREIGAATQALAKDLLKRAAG